ncbi:MAG: hypothetical protein JSU04_09420 [Bdellovibrionales bacterium]|nr:hypothetical protein [Bdellovibrionales bacterium]
MAIVRAQVLSVVLVLLSLTANAAPIQDLFEQLRDSGLNYEVVGTVCEQVSRLELQKAYPASQYEIINGIEYGDATRTIGELDVVIFEKTTKKAVLVGEVKCWKDLKSAIAKARDQRLRFQKSLSKDIALHDYQADYDKSQFSNVQKYVAIAPKGAKAAGFEMDMENSLSELMQLRDMLIKCQYQGQCAAPSHDH